MPKLEIFVKNRNFQIIKIFIKNWNLKFAAKIEIFIKNLYFCQKSIFFSKIDISVQNRHFCQKSTFLSKIEFIYKRNFRQIIRKKFWKIIKESLEKNLEKFLKKFRKILPKIIEKFRNFTSKTRISKMEFFGTWGFFSVFILF